MSGQNKKRGWIVRYWLSLAIAVTVMAAFVFPHVAVVLPDYHLIDIGVTVVMFLGSLKLAPQRFFQALRSPGLLIIGLVLTFVLAPVFSLLLAPLFGLGNADDTVAVLICSTQASTLATAIVLTEVAGGDVALAMVITVVNNLASIALTPLLFGLFGDSQVDIDQGAMAVELALKIGVPVLVGQLARLVLAEFAKRHGKKFSLVSQLIILSYIFTGVGSGLVRLGGFRSVIFTVLGFVAAFHLLQLFASALVALLVTRDSKKRVALILCGGQKTLPAAILVWKTHFAQLPLGPLVAVGYHLFQLVLDSVIAPNLLKLPLVRSRVFTQRGETAEKREGK